MSSSDAFLAGFGLILVLGIFFLASTTRRTVSIGALLVMIPFQVIDTRYASSSVIIAYTLAAVLAMNGELKLRMVPGVAAILLAYLASLAMASRDITTLHIIFVFQFASCLLVFLLAYNFTTLVESERSVMNVLLAINALVLGYCGIQLMFGEHGQFVPFGIEEFAFNENRQGNDPRLVGPFGNPGSTAGYFTLMTLVCAVELIYSRGNRRFFVQLLTGGNLLGLVATANRSGFLVLLATFLGLLYFFRNVLGTRRTLLYLFGGATVLAIAATIAIAFTDFNQMFTRMETVTETEGGIPATRQGGWPVAIEKIKEHPWFGEGPYFWTYEDAARVGQFRIEFEELGNLETTYDPYPHSLYLYLLRTVGVFGLLAVIGFFIRTWFVLNRSLKTIAEDSRASAFVRVGLVLIPAFLVAQATLEFNRPATMDYAQFIFALMGMLVGMSDRIKHEHLETAADAASEPSRIRDLDRQHSLVR